MSLFEALRGLRDSVAPDTHNNENNNNNQPTSDENDNNESSAASQQQQQQQQSLIDTDMDYDDFLLAYNKDDPIALEFIKMCNNQPPKTRDEYTKLRAKVAGIRAQELMSKLAGNILSHCTEVHNLVDSLPDRTKLEQMERISDLIEQNSIAEEALKDAYVKAQERQKNLRSVLDQVTCKSLGIDEEK